MLFKGRGFCDEVDLENLKLILDIYTIHINIEGILKAMKLRILSNFV